MTGTMALISAIAPRQNLKQVTISLLCFFAAVAIYLKSGDIRRLNALKEEHHDDVNKFAVAILVPNNEDDLQDLQFGLRSLRQVVDKETPILMFHEDDFPQEKKWEIMKWTLNPISFHLVDFEFPEGFDPDAEYSKDSSVAVQGTKHQRNLWGYSLMLRFWISGIWKQQAIRQFETVMKIDTDSCFVEAGTDVEDVILPSIRGRYVYRSYGPNKGVDAWIEGLYDFAVEYMEANKITPTHPELWERISNMWEEDHTLPVFGTSFEVDRVSFFLRREVMLWHDALTDYEPFGVLRNRWGDAQIRVLTMAMFGTKDSLEDNILMKGHVGYKHGRGLCRDHFTPNVKA